MEPSLYVSGFVPCTLHVLTHLSLTQPQEVGSIIVFILQIRKYRHREVQKRVPDYFRGQDIAEPILEPSLLLYGPCPTIQTQALAFLQLICKSASLVGTSCPEATDFLKTECLLQRCVILGVQSRAWHNEYLLNERVHKWWLLTTYFFSALSTPKGAPNWAHFGRPGLAPWRWRCLFL